MSHSVLDDPSLLGSHGDDPLGSDSHWDVVEQRLGELLLHRLNVSLVQVRPQQPDATVYVEADAACRTDETTLQRRFTSKTNIGELKRTWRHHGVWVAHVEGRHVSDRKSISGVNVWEPDGPLWDDHKQL